MFELLFRYSPAVYARAHWVLLGKWPGWLLAVLVVAFAVSLGWWLRRHLGWPWTGQSTGRSTGQSTGQSRGRVGAIWALEVLVVALILVLLWQPALSVAELKPQQNIIAVVVDDSRSMALPASNGAPNGATREAEAISRLRQGVLTDLDRRFQTRVYTLDSGVRRVGSLDQIHPAAAATRIGDGLRQLLDQTTDLPLGGIVLLSDGADNSGGLDRDTIAALRSRHIPVETVGVGSTTAPHDVEMDDALLPPQAMAQSRVDVPVRFHQHGFSGQHAILSVRSGQQLLAAQPVVLGKDDEVQTVQAMFNVGAAGAKALTFTLTPLPGESNDANNTLTRLVNVSDAPHRVLYIEGEPRWEYKYIRSAAAGDPLVHIASMLRATENKIYRQGISDPSELADGFPSRPEEMFRYQGLIIGSVQAAYFTPVQQDLIRAFANRRGGGILWLGGEYALGDGGWAESSMSTLLPVTLPNHTGTFERADLDPSDTHHPKPELTAAGAQSVITRLVDDPAANVKKWQQLPWLMDDQDVGVPKPGATVLANVLSPEGRTMPLLVTESFGRGRTAVLATSGTWRWQMDPATAVTDQTHNRFWQQLLRWLVAGTPGPVAAQVSDPMLFDHGQVQITADVRDAQYNPTSSATVAATILGPDGLTVTVPMQASPDVPGRFSADYDATKPGIYLATIKSSGNAASPPASRPAGPQSPAAEPGGDSGQDVVAFDRLDGVAENFHLEQNQELLQRLAEQTGGSYWQPSQAAQIPSRIAYSSAGITLHDNLPLWNLPIVFLLLLLVPVAEWFLRRKWGVV